MSIAQFRSATSWNGPDVILRLSIGLEDEEELWADLERFFSALRDRVTADRQLGSVRHG
jgi:cystathionine beta-lyase